MSEPKHTAGPWTTWEHGGGVVLGNVRFRSLDMKAEAQIALATMRVGITSDELEANARLIAAAPDLLAACEEVAPYVEHELDCPIGTTGYEPNCTCRVSRLRAVIAKAKGE